VITAALAFLKGVPLWVWAVIALVAGGLWYGSTRYDAGQADIQAKWDDQKALDAAATAKFNAETAKKDAARAEALRQVGFQYERDKAHALDQKDAVIRDLRAGKLSLRPQWRCPAASVPNTPGSAGSPDDAADLQFTGAGDIVRIVGTCEAQVKGLQAVVEADRQ
jgi:hypothetical protein